MDDPADRIFPQNGLRDLVGGPKEADQASSGERAPHHSSLVPVAGGRLRDEAMRERPLTKLPLVLEAELRHDSLPALARQLIAGLGPLRDLLVRPTHRDVSRHGQLRLGQQGRWRDGRGRDRNRQTGDDPGAEDGRGC